MDYRRLFVNRRTRRQQSRLNRLGEPIDLLQLMRRRTRYRPYAFSRFNNRSRNINLPNFDVNYAGNLNWNRNSVHQEDPNLYESVERQNVATNTEFPCCSASTLYSNQMEGFPDGLNLDQLEAERQTAAGQAIDQVHEDTSLENIESEERQQPATENVRDEDSIEGINIDRAQIFTRGRQAASSSEDVRSEDSSIKTVTNRLTPELIPDCLSLEEVKSNDSNTTLTDLSSNADDQNQPSHNSSLIIVPSASEESSTMPTTSMTAYIQVHRISSREDNISNSSTNNETQPLDVSPVDSEAGGDGHHNNSALQFEITLTTTVADVETDSEENEEGDHNEDNNEESGGEEEMQLNNENEEYMLE